MQTIENIQNECLCETAQPVRTDRGEWVCAQCGVVLDRVYANQEQRTFACEDRESRVQSEVVSRDFGPRTLMGVPADLNGALGSVDTRYFKRLSRIQNSMITSEERNYWEAQPKYKAYVAELCLPGHVATLAWRIYRKVVQLKLTAGRTLDGLIGAAIYLAINQLGIARNFSDVVQVCGARETEVQGYISLIVQQVFPVLGIRHKSVNAGAILDRFASKLGLAELVVQDVRALLIRAQKAGYKTSGFRPTGIVAAAIYLVAHEKGIALSQVKIAQIGEITTVTLRSRVTDLAKYL